MSDDEHPRSLFGLLAGDISFGKRYKKALRHGKPRAGNSIPHVTIGGVEKKSCAKCAKLLPLSEFGPDKGKRDGLSPRCKACVGSGGDGSTNGEHEKRGYK